MEDNWERTEEQKRNTHLVIGPWDHSSDPDVIPDYDFGPNATRDHNEAEIRFFARHLKEAQVHIPSRCFSTYSKP